MLGCSEMEPKIIPHTWHGRIRRGGGGSRGSGPPFLGHDIGFLTLGPKLDPSWTPPPFFACRPKMDPPPFEQILDPPLYGMLILDSRLAGRSPSPQCRAHQVYFCVSCVLSWGGWFIFLMIILPAPLSTFPCCRL